MTTKQPDWERIEQFYRAGLLSVREIATSCGVSHTAIQKRAKANNWDRDLKAKIKVRADSIVAKCEVASQVSTAEVATQVASVATSREAIEVKASGVIDAQQVATQVATETGLSGVATESAIIEVNAQVIASIRMAHRGDIKRSRRLANKLLDELEELTDNRELFDQLGELLRSEDDSGQDRRNDLYQKIIDLPSRTKTMKEIGETLKNLIALERQAYSIDAEGGKDPEQAARPKDLPTDPIEAARAYQAFMLGG